jgi:hypothetical protein
MLMGEHVLISDEDGAIKHPHTTGEKLRFAIALFFSIGGQTMQNIAVPMFLSETTDDMGIMLAYTTMIYFLFFTFLDLFLGFFTPRKNQIALDMDHKLIAVIGLQNALGGIGILFGGSPDRTPLPLQMSFFLMCNQLAPIYKVLRRYGLHPSRWKAVLRGTGKRGGLALAAATGAYLIAMILVLQDNLSRNEGDSKTISAYCMFFIGGTMCIMMYNVDQDIVMSGSRTINIQTGEAKTHEQLSFMTHFRRDVTTLRYQCAWLCAAGWIGPLVSVLGGSESGELTQEVFNRSWANLLPFSNTWINVLNGAYIVTFLGNIYINRFDSAFTMIVCNVSAVSAMWTGWVPSLMLRTVGFSPNYGKTISAMILSLAAIFPSWEFSKCFRQGLAQGDIAKQSEETAGVTQHLVNSEMQGSKKNYL